MPCRVPHYPPKRVVELCKLTEKRQIDIIAVRDKTDWPAPVVASTSSCPADGRVEIVLPATLYDERNGQPDALAQEHDDQQEGDQRDGRHDREPQPRGLRVQLGVHVIRPALPAAVQQIQRLVAVGRRRHRVAAVPERNVPGVRLVTACKHDDDDGQDRRNRNSDEPIKV